LEYISSAVNHIKSRHTFVMCGEMRADQSDVCFI